MWEGKDGLVVLLPQDSETATLNLDRMIPLSYEHNRQRRCAPTTGNLKPKAVATFTEIRSIMSRVDPLTAQDSRPRTVLEPFVLLLTPYAPHLAEELWEKLGHKQSLARESWPAYDPALLVEETVQVVVQINGKIRDRLDVPAQISKDDLEKLALAHDRIKDAIAGKQVKKVIVVPGKLVNIVVV